MKNECISQMTVYPGMYTSPISENKATIQPDSRSSSAPCLPVHVSEQENMYLLDISIPGIDKGYLHVETYKDDLSVRVLHPGNVTKAPTAGDDMNDLMEQHFRLPNTAETSFVAAEYVAGVLHLHLPKAKTPLKNGQSVIVVY